MKNSVLNFIIDNKIYICITNALKWMTLKVRRTPFEDPYMKKSKHVFQVL